MLSSPPSTAQLTCSTSLGVVAAGEMGGEQQGGGVVENVQWDGATWQVGVGTGQLGGVSTSFYFLSMGGERHLVGFQIGCRVMNAK